MGLLQSGYGVFFAFLFVGHFSAESTCLAIFVQKRALAGTGACELSVLLAPDLNGYPSECEGQKTNGQ